MKKYTAFIVVALMIATLACTKFKDDSFISLRSPEKRLYGYWKIVAFEVDGADSLANLYTYADFSNCNFHFYYDKGSSQSKIDGCVNNWINGWGVDTKEKQFLMVDYFIYPGRDTGVIKPFDILKLYKNDFWIQKIIYRKKYVVRFKKQ